MKKLKQFFKKHLGIMYLLSFLYRIIFLNWKKIKGNSLVICKGSFMKHCSIEVYGSQNKIEIEPLTKLDYCHIFVRGNNNHIKIGRECVTNRLEIWVQDEGNVVEIGHNTWVTGKTHLAVTEGTVLQIGKRSLLSEEIVMRTSDSHSIFDLEGKRLNPAQDIKIGDHVWIGNRVILLKGARVGDNSVIGAGAIVTKEFEANSLLAGNPAKLIRKGICWDSETK